MKKLSCALLVLLCVAFLAPDASAAANDAFVLYQNAVDEIGSLKSIEYRTMFTSIYDDYYDKDDDDYKDDDDDYVEAWKNTRTQQVRKEDAIDALRTTYLDNGSSVKRYYKDHYQYTNVGGKYKVKSKLPLNKTMLYEFPTDLTKDLFRKAQLETVANGTQVTITMPSSGPHGITADLEEYEYLKDKTAGLDIQHVFFFNDSNRLTRYQVILSNPDLNGKYVHIVSDSRIISRNKLDRIYFPKDLSSYTEQ